MSGFQFFFFFFFFFCFLSFYFFSFLTCQSPLLSSPLCFFFFFYVFFLLHLLIRFLFFAFFYYVFFYSCHVLCFILVFLFVFLRIFCFHIFSLFSDHFASYVPPRISTFVSLSTICQVIGVVFLFFLSLNIPFVIVFPFIFVSHVLLEMHSPPVFFHVSLTCLNIPFSFPFFLFSHFLI